MGGHRTRAAAVAVLGASCASTAGQAYGFGAESAPATQWRGRCDRSRRGHCASVGARVVCSAVAVKAARVVLTLAIARSSFCPVGTRYPI
jgi:hypothetical protein